MLLTVIGVRRSLAWSLEERWTGVIEQGGQVVVLAFYYLKPPLRIIRRPYQVTCVGIGVGLR